jgi:hypothetical protein
MSYKEPMDQDTPATRHQKMTELGAHQLTPTTSFPTTLTPDDLTTIHQNIVDQMEKLHQTFSEVLATINPQIDAKNYPHKYAIALRTQDQYLRSLRTLCTVSTSQNTTT